MKTKEPVKLREKILADGSRSLYLDIYRDGKRHKEYLKLYLIDAKTAADKEQNRQTLATAQAIKAKRQIELQNGEYSFTQQFRDNTLFLDYFKELCDQSRDKNWKSALVHLQNYAGEKTRFKDITPQWILGFKEYLDHVEKDAYKKNNRHELYLYQPLSQNSKVTYFNKLRACLKKAFEDRVIKDNPMRGIEGFKNDETHRAYLTLDELKKLATTPCRVPGLKRAFMFSCLTGIRKSDILAMTWSEVEKFGEYTRIVFRQQKTGGQEYLDISSEAEVYMGERGRSDEHVFKGFVYGSATSMELQRWAMAAGILKELTFHSARHTFAVLMLELGTDIYTVSKLLGHKDLSTTQIYAKVLDKSKQRAVSLIPKLLEEEE